MAPFNMDWTRNLLLAGIAVVLVLLVIQYNKYQEAHKPVFDQTTIVEETMDSSLVDEIPSTENLPTASAVSGDIPVVNDGSESSVVTPSDASRSLIKVQTDVFDLRIDPLGGDIVMVALRQYPAKRENPDQPFILLNRTGQHTYVAETGLAGRDGTDKNGIERPLFNSSSRAYSLGDNQEKLVIDLSYQQSADVTITKRFTFERGNYLINIDYLVDNRSSAPWKAAIYSQIRRDSYIPPADTGIGVKPYVGAAITTTEENYKKLSFDDIEELTGNPQAQAEEQLDQPKQNAWVAMLQHYFISAFIGPEDASSRYQIRKSKDFYLLGLTGSVETVAPQSQGQMGIRFYAGPKDVYKLEEISPNLDLTVDYGWLWWISKPLFSLLHWIHSFLGNWGWSIIVLTIIVKAIFFLPSASSYKSMAKMRKFQPRLKALQERYKDNRQKLSEEMMKLYKQEKINPLGGCLPMLIPMPVFIALYYVLLESVELRQAPWIFWIQDLSLKDPYLILPLLMGLTMWGSQKLNPAPTDPTQARVMQMLPIVFTVMFSFFPAGLVLYWTVNSLLSMIQQWIITRNIEKSA